MSEWTESARKTLDEYCARFRANLQGTGADANEVIDDLRRHVEEETRAAQLSVVTEDDVRRILVRIGEPAVSAEQKAGRSAPPDSTDTHAEKKHPGFLLLLLGVILPAITLGFELVTGISAGVLFDPIPSWFQVLIIALVPAVNFWIWRAARARNVRHSCWLSWLNGAALGVCFYYAVMYLPFMPIASIGVIYFGLGLIPLTPMLALIATPILRASYRKRIGVNTLSGGWRGAFIALAVLLVLQLPVAVTYYGLAEASSEDAATRNSGVRVLRAFGDKELMLRACYGLLGRELDFDLVRIAASGNHVVNADEARAIYYRVTGKPFNSIPPPSLYTRTGRWSALDDEFTWDDGVGGNAVAGRVKGLSLASSRMDAVAETDAALVYCEWTLEFKNGSPMQREARAQIALPPGAVVTRVTLWIDGEEREAAFGGRAQTRKAYQKVAVVQRRDPILVTTCGPDRVLMQCFPVQPNGGVMKVRLGITAPLVLTSLDCGQFVWPRFLERNFGMAADFKHTLWMESPQPLVQGTNLVASAPESKRYSLREILSEMELDGSVKSVEVRRSPDVPAVSTPADTAGRVVRQTIHPTPANAPSRLILVLDGSQGMDAAASEISEAISELPDAMEIAAVIASDAKKNFEIQPQRVSPGTINGIRESIRNARFTGGQDNFPALEAAWDLAASVENGVVLWVHAPEPVLLSSESALCQRIERANTKTRLLELQAQNGPDRLVEKLDGLGSVEHLVKLSSVRAAVRELVGCWKGQNQRFEFVREQMTASPEMTNTTRASKHVARLWARDEALRLAAKREVDEAMTLAADYQLVHAIDRSGRFGNATAIFGKRTQAGRVEIRSCHSRTGNGCIVRRRHRAMRSRAIFAARITKKIALN